MKPKKTPVLLDRDETVVSTKTYGKHPGDGCLSGSVTLDDRKHHLFTRSTPSVAQVLHELREAGYQICLFTSGGHAFQSKVLEVNELLHLFDRES